MVKIRECGHSVDTSNLAYRRNPSKCISCAWLQRHPTVHAVSPESRVVRSNNMKMTWSIRKQNLGAKNG